MFGVLEVEEERKPRWSREDDKKLFAKIREFEREGLITFKHILKINPRHKLRKFKTLAKLASSVNWEPPLPKMVERIQILSRPQFSVRELKQLKSIIYHEYKDAPVDYDKILYEFPGRTYERVVEVVDEVLAKKKKRMLSSMYTPIHNH